LRHGILRAALAAWVGVCVGGEVAAQEAPVRLTVEEAVRRAVTTSEEVQLAQAQQALAESQVIQARAGALPQVNASLAYNRTLASIFEGLSLPGGGGEGGGEEGENPFAALPFGQANTWIASLQLSQPIYSGGRVGAALEIARQVRRAAALDVEEAEAEISLQVRNAYFQTVLADRMVAITREVYELADAQLRQVELFRQQGTASEFDLLRARVERDNLEPGIVEAENARRLAELNLKRLANIPAGEEVELTTPLDPTLLAVDRAELRASLDRRAALQALDAAVIAREGAVRIARAGRLPSVGANANFSYQAFPTEVLPFDADWRRDWGIGFQVSVPVFDGFRTRGQIRQAQAELTQAQLQREQVRQGLELDLEAALGEFDAALAQIEARRATVAQARRALELAELRFRSGLSTQLEVSNARLLLEQARVNEAQSLYDYVNALARLERSSGGEVPLLDPRLPGE
jgi:outer membrane protein TolC